MWIVEKRIAGSWLHMGSYYSESEANAACARWRRGDPRLKYQVRRISSALDGSVVKGCNAG
jgi:hypothetical protein